MSVPLIASCALLVVIAFCLATLQVRLNAADREWRAVQRDLERAKELIIARDDKLAAEERLLAAAAKALRQRTEGP